MTKLYDAIVIGAGHAGVEAAHALAVTGKKTLLVSLSLEAVAFMACNPNIGGTAKGHLVKEVDALGGIMGEVADKATLQTRMLNLGNGPAVHSLRAQVDKNLYHRLMKERMETTENLTIIEGDVVEVLVEDGSVKGVKNAMGEEYLAKAVVLAMGVYLNSRIITGNYSRATGPAGFMRSEGLTQNLIDLGLDIRRFKTGTPPRLLSSSIDYDKMEIQKGDEGLPTFSMLTEDGIRNDKVCYLTYTNAVTHDIILSNLDKAPMYNGQITGTGPRYCPSIETKVVRFADKERHQIFIEPEGADTAEMYAQGLSTSLPYDIQEKMVHSVVGLENAVITRYGYAIEYDCINPLELNAALGIKKIKGLYSAGQINGSSGYEEAAAQGLIAGINASRYIDGKEPFLLRRDEAYIGVLIDDLVTKGTEEPYRMMTSRAEYRLHLRQDNADMRLTEKGRELGLVKEDRYTKYQDKVSQIEEIRSNLKKRYKTEEVKEAFEEIGESLPQGSISAEEILKRGRADKRTLIAIDESFNSYSPEALSYVAVELKYEGYLKKEEQAIKEARRMEEKLLPENIDYSLVEGLRLEARQKLNDHRPMTLAQAARISGVTPADVNVLILHLRKIQG
ncbi:MAG: tRNA uridine-5-carboxymethylaminomethyl(34) synthesis enzyme MnmG [Clostridia bacterium]|nr:tRNA uridine-5-carboxymethylaminomethyl(34) synthesis enzyme MnmG [Clostridia bacterium]MBO7156053.1 tRNA uridine-5-carboxymethylaminomethyl(34) synthesis enzyme MnmG [Clostridia bacterium]